MNISFARLLILALIAFAAYSITLEQAHDADNEFCWRDSYGRGVGTIPSDCGHRKKIGLLCYDHCPSGYYQVGFGCQQYCPAGFADQGLFCRLVEYGRGAGYPYHASDWFKSQPRMDRCENDYGRGNCEWNGAIVYPRCRPGFYAFGCCICRPATPNCHALGMNGGIDLSCAKRVYQRAPHSASCSSNQQNNAGLCYQQCRSGYNGVGPVCWANAPHGWVECGMGAAKDSTVCRDTIVGQITSVGEMALNIAGMALSAGGSAGATAAAKTAANAGKLAQLQAKMQKIKDFFQKSEKLKSLVDKAKKVANKVEQVKGYKDNIETVLDTAKQVTTQDFSTYTPADYVRLAAQIAGLADPTGIAGVIENYSHPKCSQIFK